MPSAPKRASVSCTRIRHRVDDNSLPRQVGLRRAWGLHMQSLNCPMLSVHAEVGDDHEFESEPEETAMILLLTWRI
jgi:hypothetical protein